jgi:hypothetical protein
VVEEVHGASIVQREPLFVKSEAATLKRLSSQEAARSSSSTAEESLPKECQPIGVRDRRGLPNPRVDAITQAAQEGSIMEKQPNPRICFVCGIENPIGLYLRFHTDEEGRCIARFRPEPEHQGYPGHLHAGIISILLDVPNQISVYSDLLAV